MARTARIVQIFDPRDQGACIPHQLEFICLAQDQETGEITKGLLYCTRCGKTFEIFNTPSRPRAGVEQVETEDIE